MASDVAPHTKLWRLDSDAALYGVVQPIVLQGHYALKVVRGAVSVGGTTLSEPRYYEVSCPVSPYFAIKPQYSLSSADVLSSEYGSDVEHAFADYKTVVAVKTLNYGTWARLAPPLRSLLDVSVNNLSANTPAQNLWSLPSSWSEVGSKIEAGDRIVLVGPKNSGKSSLARYMCNDACAKGHRVFYLELDPGQPEFCPPGTLSLHSITSPHFGLALMDSRIFQNTERALFLGYPSPMEVPDRYLEMCQSLFNHWKDLIANQQSGKPAILIINTPGWTKGIGLELNIAVSTFSAPSIVIHMGEDRSYEQLKQAVGNTEVPLLTSVAQIETDQQKFSSADLRNLRLMAYFHASNPLHLTAWAPYQILVRSNTDGPGSLKGVGLIDSQGIDPQDYGLALEGTVVAVLPSSGRESIQGQGGQDQRLPILEEDAVKEMVTRRECIGYAVVQAVSEADNWIRLLVPFDIDVIKTPVVLVRGRLQLPLWEYWDQAKKEVSSPWLSTLNQGVGSAHTKTRRNLSRR